MGEEFMGEILQTADVVHEADVSPSGVMRAVREGRLRVWAKTKRGICLFRAGDVAAYVKTRRQRAAGRAKGQAG